MRAPDRCALLASDTRTVSEAGGGGIEPQAEQVSGTPEPTTSVRTWWQSLEVWAKRCMDRAKELDLVHHAEGLGCGGTRK